MKWCLDDLLNHMLIKAIFPTFLFHITQYSPVSRRCPMRRISTQVFECSCWEGLWEFIRRFLLRCFRSTDNEWHHHSIASEWFHTGIKKKSFSSLSLHAFKDISFLGFNFHMTNDELQKTCKLKVSGKHKENIRKSSLIFSYEVLMESLQEGRECIEFPFVPHLTAAAIDGADKFVV